MKITILGNGTSHGIPVIACSCPVCRSTDSHDKRYRSSIMVESRGTVIVIDTGYEFRLAALRSGLSHLDAVLYTHSHSDHIMGLDDLRVFTHDGSLPLYGSGKTLEHISKVFDYAFTSHDWPHETADRKEEEAIIELRKHNYGLPLLKANIVAPFEEVRIGCLSIKAIPLMHGMMEIFGYRIGKLAYLTDVSSMSDESLEAIKGVDTLIIGALRERRHPTHFTFLEAREIAVRCGCRRCYFTHISHETSYEEINRRYAPLCQSSYDNLVLEVEDE